MATLSAGLRRRFPSSKPLELPAKRKRVIEAAPRPRAVKARAAQPTVKGKLTPAAAARIRAKANRILAR